MRQEGDVLATGVRLNVVPNLTARDLEGLGATVTRLADALRLPPDQARAALASVNMGSYPLPSPTRINDVREAVRAARQNVLDAVRR